MKRTKPIDLKKAEQLLKVVTVLLRDESDITYHEASLIMAYCWRMTETYQQSVAREEQLEMTLS